MIEAEQSIISSMIQNPDCIDMVLESINADDIQSPMARNAFTTIVQLTNESIDVDVLSVAEKMNNLDYVTDLITNAHTFNVSVSIEIIKKESSRRKALKSLEQARDQVLSADSVEQQVQALESLADSVESGEPEYRTLPEVMKSALQRFSDKINGKIAKGIQTGFKSIDERLGGLVRGNMIVVGARPAMGKTTFAMNIAENVAYGGGKVLVFSMEMSDEEIADRMISSASNIPMNILRNPEYTEESFGPGEQQKLEIGLRKVKGIENRLTIIDKPSMHVDHVRNISRKFNRGQKLDLIVIDYLQLMRSGAKNRFDEISEVSRSIKAMAKQIDVPVIVLSQLSREVEKRSDSRPVNSDLRESGQIEQDADIIMFLYRDEVYNDKESNPNKGLAEVITSKFRNGQTGTDYLEGKLHVSRFENTARSHIEAQESGFRPAYAK
jgi:replicative DNA helicase